MALPTGVRDDLNCTIYGQTGYGVLAYASKAVFHVRHNKSLGFDVNEVFDVVDLYRAGAVRNIASFYEDVIAGRCENPTVRRAVDGCLTCILGREAAARDTRLTMDEVLKENRRIELDLSGLRA